MFYRSSNPKSRSGNCDRSNSVTRRSLRVLRDQTSSYTQCSYCGRTLQFNQLMRHLKVWHGYGTKDFIIDFNGVIMAFFMDYIYPLIILRGFLFGLP